MYKAAEALKTYYSGFGLPAYQEGSVPDDEPLPYISYSVSIPEWSEKASNFVRVWDRTKSNTGIIRKADQILQSIGLGKKIAFAGGYLMIWPETPNVQIEVDGDVRYAYINLSINSYNLPGV